MTNSVIDNEFIKAQPPVYRNYWRKEQGEEKPHQVRRVYGDEMELDYNRMIQTDLRNRL